MTLINCPECGTEVSDRAEACLKCAYPIAITITSQGSTNLGTERNIGLTAKRLKLISLISFFVIAIGIIIIIASASSDKAIL